MINHLFLILVLGWLIQVQAKTAAKIETPQEYKKYVAEFVKKKSSQLKVCEKGLKPKGRMVIQWEVGPDGTPSDFTRGADNVEIPELYHCVEKKMGGWKFAPPPNEMTIELEYDFVYKQKK